MMPPSTVQTSMLRPTTSSTSRSMPLENQASTVSMAATTRPRAAATGSSRRTTRQTSCQRRLTSPSAMARMTRVADWLPALPPMSTMGAMKAASTMTCDRISSCAATKVLVTTPNRVSSTSQNTRTLNILRKGDSRMSRSVPSVVTVPPKRASWVASSCFSMSMASSTVTMPTIFSPPLMTGRASRS